MSDLHIKYAPILRFARGERFFPMHVLDMLPYSSMYVKDRDTPLFQPGEVTPDQLARHGRSGQVFLRSVDTGPRQGIEVVSTWGKQAVELVYRSAQKTTLDWTQDLARTAYTWFSSKTQSATKLFWWNSLLSPMLKKAKSGQAGELPRFLLPQEMRDQAAARYATGSGHRPPYTYYYRQVRDGNYECLQYWFFYLYNDWARGFKGMNDHEGDWESMMVFFGLDTQGRPQEPPAYVTFVGHHSRLTKPWEHKDVERVGTHPVGYVAAGSHATYPECKPYPIIEIYGLTDYATGDGPAIDHDQWQHRISLQDVPWLASYLGSWGTRYWLSLKRARAILPALSTFAPAASTMMPREIELPGVSAPHGPKIGDTGEQRPQWDGPVAWAGVPDA